jgi:hypothetical protein
MSAELESRFQGDPVEFIELLTVVSLHERQREPAKKGAGLHVPRFAGVMEAIRVVASTHDCGFTDLAVTLLVVAFVWVGATQTLQNGWPSRTGACECSLTILNLLASRGLSKPRLAVPSSTSLSACSLA